MAVANRELLKLAIQRGIPAIITAGEGQTRRQVMVQFSNKLEPEGVWAEFQDQDAVLLQRMIDAANPVVVWFQSDTVMAQFSTRVVKKKHGLGRHTILIQWPDNISIVEERHQPRWMVPASFPLSARLQVLAPNRSVEYDTDAKIWDIGAEGASIICPSNKRLLITAKEAWIKVLLRIRGNEYSYTAMYRHMSPASDDTLRLGVQFIPSGDPSAAHAHEALMRLIAELQQVCGHKSNPATNAA